MKKILIGNDITLRWLIKNSEDQPIDFENTNAVVKIVHRDLPGVLFIPPFSREGNELTIFFPADKQKELGVYHLLLTFNDGHTVRIAARGVFYLSDIYDTDSHADSPFVETVDIDIIHVESEISMVNGRDGKNGKSAYQIAVDNGFTGTEQEWLDSIIKTSGAQTTNTSQNNPQFPENPKVGDNYVVTMNPAIHKKYMNGTAEAGC